jgi:hypothetical protein
MRLVGSFGRVKKGGQKGGAEGRSPRKFETPGNKMPGSFVSSIAFP